MRLRIHAIVLALNEEVFIGNQLKTLYPFCSGISVLTQYDRDWYGKIITPDQTLTVVCNFPDPEGKIHLVMRRWPDEAAARNSEMLSLSAHPDRGIMSHGSSIESIKEFHRTPDYFLIVDADEFYDPASFPAIVKYLSQKRPRGMRVHGFNYVRTWNRRVPREVVKFCHFGFVRPGVLFKMRRTISWNESRCAKLLRLCQLPDISARLWGFIQCPPEVGIFHHGCWLGDNERLAKKAEKSSHREINHGGLADHVSQIPFVKVTMEELPSNLRPDSWPGEFFDKVEIKLPDLISEGVSAIAGTPLL
jgi:hypothetical protein